jgi:MerR family transcriptional regulator, redox-sensitive transcriptional activator SoxR
MSSLLGQLAQRAGLRASAIRYYESIGLLPPAERRSGRRVYGAEALARLQRVALAQSAGFSLEETRLMERGLEQGEDAPARWRRMAALKLREVDAQLARLRQMRALLHDAARCRCTSMGACPLLGRERPAPHRVARGARRVPPR